MSANQSRKPMEPMEPIPDIGNLEMGRIIHAVLSDFFEYRDDTGDKLNLCETLLLIKESIDQNTSVQQKILTRLTNENNDNNKDK
jgi:hypothetical protein